jgi:hypothetical protein
MNSALRSESEAGPSRASLQREVVEKLCEVLAPEMILFRHEDTVPFECGGSGRGNSQDMS